MKPLSLSIIPLFLLASTLFFTSCIEDAIPKKVAAVRAAPGDSTFAATDSAQAYWVNSYLNITAEDDEQSINISIVDFDGPGIYEFDNSSETPKSAILAYQAHSLEYPFMSNEVSGTTGSIIIQDIDTIGDGYVNGLFSTYTRRESDDSLLLVSSGIIDSIPVERSLPPAGDQYLRATIGGVPFEAGSIVAGVPSQTGQLSIIGSNNKGTSGLGLFLPSTIQPGTYSFDEDSGISAFFSESVAKTFRAQSGVISIISHDQFAREISGTFSFSVEDINGQEGAISITSGSFFATY